VQTIQKDQRARINGICVTRRLTTRFGISAQTTELEEIIMKGSDLNNDREG